MELREKISKLHCKFILSLSISPPKHVSTGFSSEIGTKLRDWAVGQAGGRC